MVAQLLDYGSWVRSLEDTDIAGIFEESLKKYYPNHSGTSLDEAFCKKFGVEEMPEAINESHELGGEATGQALAAHRRAAEKAIRDR